MAARDAVGWTVALGLEGAWAWWAWRSLRTGRLAAGTWASWPAPLAYNGLIGPGPGLQPNGVYQVATAITIPAGGGGVYNYSIRADDAAQFAVDGVPLGVVTFRDSWRNPVAGQISLSPGAHLILLTVVNNGRGTDQIVPYNSGLKTPTGVRFVLTSATGRVLVTTDSAAGWHYSGYWPQVTHGRLATLRLDLQGLAGPSGTPGAATPGREA